MRRRVALYVVGLVALAGCSRSAVLMGERILTDDPVVREQVTRCDEGDGRVCLELAEMLVAQGAAEQPGPFLATARRRACDSGADEVCNSLVSLQVPDSERFEFRTAAARCDQGDARGCVLSIRYAATTSSWRLARLALDAACGRHDPTGCQAAVARAWQHAELRDAAGIAARDLCVAGERDACGVGLVSSLAADVDGSALEAAQACDRAGGAACVEAGDALDASGREAAAARAWDRACDSGVIEACVARTVATARSEDLTANERAHALTELAMYCDRQVARACDAWLDLRLRDPEARAADVLDDVDRRCGQRSSWCALKPAPLIAGAVRRVSDGAAAWRCVRGDRASCVLGLPETMSDAVIACASGDGSACAAATPPGPCTAASRRAVVRATYVDEALQRVTRVGGASPLPPAAALAYRVLEGSASPASVDDVDRIGALLALTDPRAAIAGLRDGGYELADATNDGRRIRLRATGSDAWGCEITLTEDFRHIADVTCREPDGSIRFAYEASRPSLATTSGIFDALAAELTWGERYLERIDVQTGPSGPWSCTLQRGDAVWSWRCETARGADALTATAFVLPGVPAEVRTTGGATVRFDYACWLDANEGAE